MTESMMRQAVLMQWPKKFEFPALQLMQSVVLEKNDKSRVGV
jgi:hypothetical protein